MERIASHSSLENLDPNRIAHTLIHPTVKDNPCLGGTPEPYSFDSKCRVTGDEHPENFPLREMREARTRCLSGGYRRAEIAETWPVPAPEV